MTIIITNRNLFHTNLFRVSFHGKNKYEYLFWFVLRIWPFDCSFLLINSIQKERPVRFSKPCINLMNFRDFFLLKIGKCFQLGAVIEKAKIDHLTPKGNDMSLYATFEFVGSLAWYDRCADRKTFWNWLCWASEVNEWNVGIFSALERNKEKRPEW